MGIAGIFLATILAVTVAAPGCAPAAEKKSMKRVFVTSTSFAVPEIGGLAGADQKCQAAADSATAAGLGSFAGATWKAWLSDSKANAIDRIVDVGPWYRVDGVTKVANNKAQLALVPAQLLASVGSTERGRGANLYWTGTDAGGVARNAKGQFVDAGTCQDWTVTTGCTTVGSPQAASVEWTYAHDNVAFCAFGNNQSDGIGTGCGDTYALLCFEQ